MNRKIALLSGILFLFLLEASADMYLVRNKKPYSTIVISSYATENEIKAANILEDYLYRISKVKIPIEKDNNIVNFKGNIISIGKTDLVPSDIKEKLRIDEKISFIDPFNDSFVIKTTKDRLFLLGHRDEGTIFSVYDFLEGLGCRWFFACEAGEVIPRMSDIKIKEINLLKSPDFAFRQHDAWDGHRTQKTIDAETKWHQENKMSAGRIKGLSGHNFSSIWPETLYKDHPEYFPLVDGKRIPYGQRCLSNPGIIKLGIEWADKTLQEHPEYEVISFVQNDEVISFLRNDGVLGFCRCEECKKIGNFADQNLYLANEVGKVILEKYPDKMIHIMSYFESARIPHIKADGYDENKDRVLVEIYTNSTKTPFNDLVQGWAKASHNLFVGDAWQWFYWNWQTSGRPTSYISRLQRYRFFKENNVKGIRTITKAEWARHGLSRYLSAKLMWDVNADIDKLRLDFCEKMFPSATTDFYNFISLYDEITEGSIDLREFLKKGFFFLDRIKKQIKSEEEKKRWEFYALYLHEECLEYKMDLAETKKEKYKIIKDIISFLKGTEDLGILESSQRIPVIYYAHIKHLTGGTDLPEISSMEISSKKIEEMFNKDKELFKTSIGVMQRKPL